MIHLTSVYISGPKRTEEKAWMDGWMDGWMDVRVAFDNY